MRFPTRHKMATEAAESSTGVSSRLKAELPKSAKTAATT